jgi:hypothetical protein
MWTTYDKLKKKKTLFNGQFGISNSVVFYVEPKWVTDFYASYSQWDLNRHWREMREQAEWEASTP